MPGHEYTYRFVAGPGRDVLVPLPPGVARAGHRRPARPAGGATRARRPVPCATWSPWCTRTTGSPRVERADSRRRRGPRAGPAGPGARDQHRQRPDQGLGERALPGRGGRRSRRARPDRGRRPRGRRHRRRAAIDLEVTAPADGSDVRRAGRRRDRGAGRAARHRPGPGAAAARERARPAVLRHPGPARLRPGARDPVFDYAIGRRPGFVRRQARAAGGRSTATCSRDVPMFVVQRGRRRAGADLQLQRRRAPDAPARAPRRRALPRRRHGHRQPVVVRLAQRRERRDLRRRVRRRQPRHLDGPLPQPARTRSRAWSRT